jgi:hypothetical protein
MTWEVDFARAGTMALAPVNVPVVEVVMMAGLLFTTVPSHFTSTVVAGE